MMDTDMANSLKDLRWHWRHDACARLRRVLESGDWVDAVELVKHTPRRSVYRKSAHHSDACPGIYLKHEHPVNPRDIIKLLFRNKTRMEFDCACRLYQAGIHTAEPVGWGRNKLHSVLATCEIEGAVEFLPAWEGIRNKPDRRADFLEKLGCCLNSLVRHGVSHPDMHVGNILVNHGSDGWDFFLLDTYKCRVGKPMSPELLRRCLGWIVCIVHELSDAEIAALMHRSFANVPVVRHQEVWNQVLRAQHRQIRLQGRGRRKRLFSSGSICTKVTADDGTWIVMKDQNIEDMAAAVAAHRDNRTCDKLLKDDRKRRLSRVDIDGSRYVVKEFRSPGRLDIHTCRADARSWFNTYRLGRHYIPIARALGWLKADSGKGYIVMEDAGEDCLYYGLENRSTVVRRRFMKAAGKLTAWLHLASVHHRDLKCSNFMITDPAAEHPMPLCLIDLDAVRFPRSLTGHSQCRNVLQFLESLPSHATYRERLTYLAAYHRVSGISRTRIRQCLKQAERHGFIAMAPAVR
jgi:tRNA A-37 threonylcarbamoyl transferase component Bud32